MISFAPRLEHATARMDELDRLIPPGIRPEWEAWRQSWGRSLPAQGRLGELWWHLGQWEQRAAREARGPRYERATAAMVSGCVAGVWTEHSASDLLDWMIELDQQMRTLDADIHSAERVGPRWGSAWEGAWQNFYSGPTPNTAGEQPPPRVAESNWRKWFAAHKGWTDRWYNTADRWAEMGRWDQAFERWHKTFVGTGGRPQQTTVIVGPDKTPERPVSLADVRTLGTGILLVGGIIGLGYLIRSFK